MKVLLSHTEEKEYPLCPKEFSDELFSEEMALKIHGQTLQKLNDRGGMSPFEMMMNVLCLTYRSGLTMDTGRCIGALLAIEYAMKNEKNFFKSF